MHLLNSSLVRLLTDNQSPRNPVGAGCLVSISARHILTCAHVVAQVLNIDRTSPDKPSTPLYLDFPLLPQQPMVQAVVEEWRPVCEKPVVGEIEDIALLKLTTEFPLPMEARPVQLSTGEGKLEQGVKLFGFPSGKLEGVYLDGQVKGMMGTGQVEIHIKPGHGNVQGGFSGSPVWNADKTEVLGLLQEISEYDGTIHAYMIPATTLRQVFGAQIIENPYRGLAAFRQADANVFFGRDGEIRELLGLVNKHRFIALVGVSGSGKSSVVFAGLVPRLKQQQWQVIECRPENNPFNRLAAALVKLLASDKLTQAKQLTTLEKELPTGEVTLAALVQVWHEESHQRLLLIIDQFEELYTANSTAVQQQFLACLLKLVKSEVPVVVLVTLRADFMSQALTYPEFAQALNGNTRFISGMSRAELEEVIEKPAAQVGLRLEAGLTATILKDLGTEGGRLPLLQFALTSLFEKQQWWSLTHEAYTEIGGVKQALVRYADQELAHFSAMEHDQLRQIFVQLVHPGQGTEDTRLVVPYSQLADKWVMVKRLADSRLVVTGRNEETQQETVEVIHEALIRQWPRLQEWMREDRAFRVWQEELRPRIQQWQKNGRGDEDLLRGSGLLVAEEKYQNYQNWLPLIEQRYIEDSITLRDLELEEKERSRQELEQLLAETILQKERAEHHAKVALVRQVGLQARIATDSPSLINGYIDQSCLLAVQAFRLLENFETQGNLLHVLQSHPRLGKFLRSHRDMVRSVAFSPNGQWLASGSVDNSIILWDVQTGTPIGTPWHGHREEVTSVAFSPDGQWLASGSVDKSIILWDVKTGTPIGTPWHEHRDMVRSIAFSPDGLRLASGSVDNSIILWDVKTGTPIGTPWRGHSRTVTSVAFSPDGLRLASGSWDNSIILWEVQTGTPIGTPWQEHRDGVWSVAFSPNGLQLASGSEDNSIILWDVKAGMPIDEPWQGHRGGVTSVAFNPDGLWLTSGSWDGSIVLWDVMTGTPIGIPWQGHRDVVMSVAFSPDGLRLASGSSDNSIILWDVETDSTAWQRCRDVVRSVVFSPNGLRLASGCKDGSIILWDVQTGTPIGTPWQGHSEEVTSVAFSPEGLWLASGSSDKSIILWDVKTGTPVGTPWQEGHHKEVTSVTFSPDGLRLASSSWDNEIILWDVKAGTPLWLWTPWHEHRNVVRSVAFSPDGLRLASGCRDGGIVLCDVQTGTPMGTPWQGHSEEVMSVVFSPDSQWLASSSADGNIILWDVNTGTSRGTPWQGHREKVRSVAFSPDSLWLASGSDDKSIILWNVETHTPIGQFKQTNRVESVAFSPDGKLLASSNGKGVMVWDVDPHSWAARLCQKVHRNLTQEEWRRFVGEREYEKTCPQFLSGLALARLQEGEELAAIAELPNVEAAIAKFQEAFALEPELQKYPLYCFNPEVEAKKMAAPAWVSKGESLAKEEKLDEAIAAFKHAQTLDASLKFNPRTKAKEMVASVLVNKGESLAEEEKLDDAIAAFKYAQALDASLKFDPQTKAKEMVASVLVDKGESLAEEGKIDEAIAQYTKAQQLVLALDLHSLVAWAFVDKGMLLAKEGKIDEAIAQYAKAQELDPHLQVTAYQWNGLCWDGATYQQATKVMEACEKAVALDPQDFEYRDSRGLARALTGNVTGAIEDFQFFVEKTEDADKAQRQRWIEALRRGENPFTEEVLKELRGE